MEKWQLSSKQAENINFTSSLDWMGRGVERVLCKEVWLYLAQEVAAG